MNGAISPLPYMTLWCAQVVYFNVTISAIKESVHLALWDFRNVSKKYELKEREWA